MEFPETIRPLAGRRALVTGASRGIGAAIARDLHAAGAELVLVGRDRERLDALAVELHAEPIAMDVTREDDVAAAFGALGPLDILVNNAGVAVAAPLLQTHRDQWDASLAVNLTALFLTCRALAPRMVEAGWGRIVNIVSTSGLAPYRDVAAYVASKHGAVGLTRALALELARTGVTVNAVCPGYTDTDMYQGALASVMAKTGRDADEAARLLVKGNPQGRVVLPQEVARSVRYLCLPESGAVTGQCLVVAGGEVMN